ncbi:S-crystallin SL11 [Patella vulgata]|uniref:S-crystallin SL11 n=1 Tax=Patella vulgata TaxID=6465 RepID=UPI00217FF9B9|nr:S-crystallin SL11 [Patella vulgata]
MHVYRLHYFHSRGRGEVARLLFHAAGQQFDDVKYNQEGWQAFKPKTPLGQLPCLEIDGTLYAQSNAINSYLAKELGFYGNGNTDALKVDVIVGVIGDLIPILIRIFFLEQDETKKKELLNKLVTEDTPKFFTNLETILKANRNGYFVGDSLTLADIAVYDITDPLLQQKEDLLSSFSLIQENRKKVESNPGLASYLKTRK